MQLSFCLIEVSGKLSTHVSLGNVGVLAISWIVLCVLFDLLLQTCSICSLILIHPNPVSEEQECWCGWDVVGSCCRLRKKEKGFCKISFANLKHCFKLIVVLKTVLDFLAWSFLFLILYQHLLTLPCSDRLWMWSKWPELKTHWGHIECIYTYN